MFSKSELMHYISLGYFALCFIIPFIYIIIFHHYKNKKNYLKTILIFVLLIGGGLVIKNIRESIVLNSNSFPNAKESYPSVAEISGDKESIGTSSEGYDIYTIDDITYVDGYLITNKTYALPEDYEPEDTYACAIGVSHVCNDCINNTAYEAWKDMQADAEELGLSLYILSGYRPYVTQERIYNNYVEQDGKEEADTYSARPGHSEHQTALCFDVNSTSQRFANTAEGKWIAKNAYRYGFILRYPEGKTDETGYIYEAWHLRYVGTDLSYKLYNNGDWITLEDYFGLTSEYQD